MNYILAPENEPTDDTIRSVAAAEYGKLSAHHPKLYPDDRLDEWLVENFESFRDWIRKARGKPLETVPYTRELPDYGDLITVEDFVTDCEIGMFVDYDGFGNPVKAETIEWKQGLDPTQYPTVVFRMADFYIKPSTRHLIPKDATHIMWYNR